MSHRTRHLPPANGFLNAIREMRYHEASRQSLGAVLVLVYAVTAQPPAWLAAIGLSVALAGILTRLYASGHIIKNEQLATEGPYALVRHPLYTGNILVLLGFALANGTWWALPLAVVFFWFYYPCAIDYEDRKLERIFGDRWRRWAADVPALIPTFRNLGAAGRGNGWSLANSSRRNGELFIAFYCVVCMGIVVWRIV
jgi:protein-S-isoprenylcysteine O-methyltransferase Ste14